MTKFKYISMTILVCTLLQTTLIEYLSICGVKPMLLVAIAICAVLAYGLIPGAVTGLVCGVIMDITSGRGVGLSALLLMYICISCGLIRPGIFKEKIGVVMLFTFCGDVLFGFLYAFFLLFAWGKGSLDFILINRLLPEGILTAIAAIPIFLIFKRVNHSEWTDN